MGGVPVEVGPRAEKGHERKRWNRGGDDREDENGSRGRTEDRTRMVAGWSRVRSGH